MFGISDKIIVDLLIAIGALFILSNLFYLLLIVSSYKVFKRNKSGWNFMSPVKKPISLIVPAYNEEKNILTSLESFMNLNYPLYEIILVNDGSKDKTLEKVLSKYSFEDITSTYKKNEKKLSLTKIIKVYFNKELKLTLIDKENGGKSDALNAGIDFSQHEYFCSVDADSILHPEAFNTMMLEFNNDPKLIACGATIRVANGSKINQSKDSGFILENLPRKYIELCQYLEYTRSFMTGRVGWENFDSTMIISGAFGVFKKESVLSIDGFNIKSIGEDMDLIVRLHKYFLKENKEYKIGFIPDPLCWTEVPDNFESLSNQRNRWQRGLISSILTGDKILIKPGDNPLAKLTIPYYVLTEIFSPIIEIMSYILIALGVFIGIISIKIALLFFSVSILFSVMLTIVALLYEEKYYSKKLDRKSMLELILVSFLENLGYRQFMSYQRVKGILDHYRKRTDWGRIERHGLNVE